MFDRLVRFFGILPRRRSLSSRAFRSRRSLRIEPLEHRQMLAAVPELVRDINATVSPSGGSPKDFIQVNDLVFFTASTIDNGRELWETDGASE